MKRRNAECGVKPRRPIKRNYKITEGMFGSNTMLYIKCITFWAFIILLDFISEFRFEFLWPFWVFLRSVNDAYKYKGLGFTILFILIAITCDLACLYFIPASLLFVLASTYIWVNYVWHTDKGVCLPTCMLWLLFVCLEVKIRWKDVMHIPYMEWGTPFAIHCIGYPMVKLGFAFQKYISYKLNLRKQEEVIKENAYYMRILFMALAGGHDEHFIYSNKNKDRGCDVLSAQEALKLQSAIDFYDSSAMYNRGGPINNNDNNTESLHNTSSTTAAAGNQIDCKNSYTFRKSNGNEKSSTKYQCSTKNKENNNIELITGYQKIESNPSVIMIPNGIHRENGDNDYCHNDDDGDVDDYNSNDSINETYHEQQEQQPQIESPPPSPPMFMCKITDTIKSLNAISEYFNNSLYTHSTSSSLKSIKSRTSSPESSEGSSFLSSPSSSSSSSSSPINTQIETNQIDLITSTNQQNDIDFNNSTEVDKNYFIPIINNNNNLDDQKSSSSSDNYNNDSDMAQQNDNHLRKVFKFDYLQNMIREHSIDNHYLTNDDYNDDVHSNDNNNNNQNTTENGENCSDSIVDNHIYEDNIKDTELIKHDQQSLSTTTIIPDSSSINNCDLKLNKSNVELNVEHSKAPRNRQKHNKDSQMKNSKDNHNTKLKNNKMNKHHKNNTNNKNKSNTIITKVKDNQDNNNNNNIKLPIVEETIIENHAKEQQQPQQQKQQKQSISNCIKCSDLIDSIKRYKMEIKQSETNELNLKQQMESRVQTKLNIIKGQQKDLETMNKRIESLWNAYQTDQKQIEKLSRELCSERLSRKNSERDYDRERQLRLRLISENLTWNNIQCSDRCKQKKIQLETELKQLRRELSISDDLNRSKEQKIRNYEQELRNVKIDFRHRENNEVLLNAIHVLQEKNTILETNLSAETRIKLDLFSALGETKRELEIKDRLLQSREYALNIDRSKDDEITHLRSKIRELLAVITPVTGLPTQLLRQSQKQPQQQVNLTPMQELSRPYIQIQPNLFDPIFNPNDVGPSPPPPPPPPPPPMVYLPYVDHNINNNNIINNHQQHECFSSQIYGNAGGGAGNISNGNCNCSIVGGMVENGENGCGGLNFVNSTNKTYMRSPSPYGLQNMEIWNPPISNSQLQTSTPILSLSTGYASSSTSSLSSGSSSTSSLSSSSTSITLPSSISKSSKSSSSTSSSTSSSSSSSSPPIINNSLNNLRQLSYNTQEFFRSMLTTDPLALTSPSPSLTLPSLNNSSVLNIVFPSPPSSPSHINPSTTTTTTITSNAAAATAGITTCTATKTTTIMTTTTITTTSTSTKAAKHAIAGTRNKKNPISNLDPNAMVYTPKNIIFTSTDM